MVITPESSNEFPWISIWQLVKPHVNYCVDILKARWLRPALAESYWLLRVTLSRELVAVDVWNAPDQRHNCRVAGVRTAPPPPAKLNVKPGPYLVCILVFTILLISVDCVFLRFSECFLVISGFCIPVQYRICYCFSTTVWVLGSLQLSFSLAQTSSYVTAPEESKVLLQIRAMCKASSSILQ